MKTPKLLIVMGVSGTGKTTIGKLLAERLSIPFFDGDDFHPKENIKKMTSGIPLNDDDRHQWLLSLNDLLKSNQSSGAVLACSALKENYRLLLKKGVENKIRFIFLDGTYEEVKARMEKRKNHYMPLALLQSQFESLETPEEAINVSIKSNPSKIVQQIFDKL